MIRLGYTPDYKGRLVVKSEADLPLLERLVSEACAAGLVAVDTETTGLNVNQGARMFCFSFSYLAQPDEDEEVRLCPTGANATALLRSAVVFVDERHVGPGKAALPEGVAQTALTRIMNSCKVVMFNGKFDIKVLWADGIPTDNLIHDGYLDMFVLDSGFGDSIPEIVKARLQKRIDAGPVPRNLKDLCAILLGWPANERDEVKAWLEHKFGSYRKNWKYHYLPLDLVAPYACGDTERTLCLHLWLQQRLAEREQVALATQEARLTQPVAACELAGVAIHETKAAETRQHWMQVGERAYDKMLELTGLTQFEYNSDEHLGGYAWQELCRRSGQAYPIPGGWSADDLVHYVHKARGKPMAPVPEAGIHGEFCAALLDRRLSDKVIGTYIDPWLTKHGERDSEGVLRIHPQLIQDGARSGRFSSDNPNLQNVPIEARVLTAPPGRSLVFLDYSQLEYRVFAHYVGGPVLKVYQDDPSADFHQGVADMLGIDRKPAKNMNFAMLFGVGKDKVIKNLRQLCNMSEGKALGNFQTYHQKFPMAKRLYYECERRCKQRGYIKNLYGRRRYLPMEFAHKAMPNLIQGSAADIVKEAILNVWDVLPAAPLEWDVTINLQIHDELIFEVNSGYEWALYQWAKPLMETAPKLQTPLIIDAEWCAGGELWRDKHKLIAPV